MQTSEESRPPPPPPTDYHETRSTKANRNHERSKTLPVSPSDVSTAQFLISSRPASFKSDNRPGLTKRATSDQGEKTQFSVYSS
ncbi:hypothetical protein AC249_AIPGENE1647 [Exaiptasia diaphana]|nr:hypothetical protein AC249_AIPGENE1647 [Exaiptasia diaphana]